MHHVRLSGDTSESHSRTFTFLHIYFSAYSFPSHTIHTHERCGRWLGRQHVHTHLHFVHLSGGHLSDYTSKSPFVYLHFFIFSFTLSLEKIKVLKKQKKNKTLPRKERDNLNKAQHNPKMVNHLDPGLLWDTRRVTDTRANYIRIGFYISFLFEGLNNHIVTGKCRYDLLFLVLLPFLHIQSHF